LFSKELTELIVSVLTSWQVIVVTIGIVIYLFIVFNVASLYRSARPKTPKLPKGKKGKPEEVLPAEESGTDELGLEEE
jgi:flagellar biosynthesis/type III secretory pathway M-ring protein FliF/YscJ